jgi:hypothetical protein
MIQQAYENTSFTFNEAVYIPFQLESYSQVGKYSTLPLYEPSCRFSQTSGVYPITTVIPMCFHPPSAIAKGFIINQLHTVSRLKLQCNAAAQMGQVDRCNGSGRIKESRMLSGMPNKLAKYMSIRRPLDAHNRPVYEISICFGT